MLCYSGTGRSEDLSNHDAIQVLYSIRGNACQVAIVVTKFCTSGLGGKHISLKNAVPMFAAISQNQVCMNGHASCSCSKFIEGH
jgi:hypothetical protein